MKRRRFLNMLWKMALGAPALAAVVYGMPARVTEALRIMRYPGPIKPLAGDSVKRSGRWLG